MFFSSVCSLSIGALLLTLQARDCAPTGPRPQVLCCFVAFFSRASPPGWIDALTGTYPLRGNVNK